ncbi:OapA N-terminal domain-containing protein [Streptococcus pyogenes]
MNRHFLPRFHKYVLSIFDLLVIVLIVLAPSRVSP